jgi:hypothetical protein
MALSITVMGRCTCGCSLRPAKTELIAETLEHTNTKTGPDIITLIFEPCPNCFAHQPAPQAGEGE